MTAPRRRSEFFLCTIQLPFRVVQTLSVVQALSVVRPFERCSTFERLVTLCVLFTFERFIIEGKKTDHHRHHRIPIISIITVGGLLLISVRKNIFAKVLGG